MNAGDLAVEARDNEGALREYAAAEKLVPDSAEMVYWRAVALVSMGVSTSRCRFSSACSRWTATGPC